MSRSHIPLEEFSTYLEGLQPSVTLERFLQLPMNQQRTYCVSYGQFKSQQALDEAAQAHSEIVAQLSQLIAELKETAEDKDTVIQSLKGQLRKSCADIGILTKKVAELQAAKSTLVGAKVARPGPASARAAGGDIAVVSNAGAGAGAGAGVANNPSAGARASVAQLVVKSVPHKKRRLEVHASAAKGDADAASILRLRRHSDSDRLSDFLGSDDAWDLDDSAAEDFLSEGLPVSEQRVEEAASPKKAHPAVGAGFFAVTDVSCETVDEAAAPPDLSSHDAYAPAKK